MTEYDENKLTKLGALKELANRVKLDYATKQEMTNLENRVDTLEKTSGESNKINKIKVNGVEQNISETDKSVDIKVPETVAELSDANNYATIETVNTKMSSVYKPGGSVAFESLADASETNLGFVYNITKAFTTDERFVDGTGNKYPKGTNVVVVDTGNSNYKYDVLAGFVDLTDYAKSENVVLKEEGKVLSSNDYTNEDKGKLDGIEIASNEEVNEMLNEVFGAVE